jgi:hypothetical protein
MLMATQVHDEQDVLLKIERVIQQTLKPLEGYALTSRIVDYIQHYDWGKVFSDMGLIDRSEQRHIKFNATVGRSMRIIIAPTNLFTFLILVGKYVPYKALKSKTEFTFDSGVVCKMRGGQVNFKYPTPVEYIALNLNVEV